MTPTTVPLTTTATGSTARAPRPGEVAAQTPAAAAAALRPVRVLLALVLAVVVAAAVRAGDGAHLPLAAAIAATGLAAGAGARWAVAPALRTPRAAQLWRGCAAVAADAAVILAALSAAPTHLDQLWVLAALPVVEAGVLAGLPATLAAWAALAPALAGITAITAPGTPVQDLVARSCVLVLLALPIALLARALVLGTAAARAEHRRAAARAQRLATVASHATALVHREQPTVVRAALAAVTALGARTATAWRAGPGGDWIPAGGPPAFTDLVLAAAEQATTNPRTHVTAISDRTLAMRVRPGPGAADLLILAEFTPATARQHSLTAALELLARHAGVALDGAGTIETLTAAREELTATTLRDALTGLPNRVALTAALEDLHTRGVAGEHLSLLFADLDGFKAVNDTLGHHVGDLVLIEVGQRLTHTVRPGDLLARLGGDEFCALLRESAGPQGAQATAQRLIEVLEASPVHGGSISASIGIAALRPGWTPAGVIAAADEAMYDAKRAGGRRWATHTPSPGQGPRPDAAVTATQARAPARR